MNEEISNEEIQSSAENNKKRKSKIGNAALIAALGAGLVIAGVVGINQDNKNEQSKIDQIQETIAISNQIDYQNAVENGTYQLPEVGPYDSPANTELPSPTQIGDAELPAPITH